MAVNNKKNHIYGWMFMPCTMWMYHTVARARATAVAAGRRSVVGCSLCIYMWNALCPPHWHWHRVVFLAQLLHTIYYTHSGDMLKILVRRWRQQIIIFVHIFLVACSHPPGQAYERRDQRRWQEADGKRESEVVGCWCYGPYVVHDYTMFVCWCIYIIACDNIYS